MVWPHTARFTANNLVKTASQARAVDLSLGLKIYCTEHPRNQVCSLPVVNYCLLVCTGSAAIRPTPKYRCTCSMMFHAPDGIPKRLITIPLDYHLIRMVYCYSAFYLNWIALGINALRFLITTYALHLVNLLPVFAALILWFQWLGFFTTSLMSVFLYPSVKLIGLMR